MLLQIMLKEQCISVTDLRTKTKECLDDLGKTPKYIFINNQPVAVLLDIDVYEEIFHRTDLIELEKDTVSTELKKIAGKARKIPLKNLVDL